MDEEKKTGLEPTTVRRFIPRLILAMAALYAAFPEYRSQELGQYKTLDMFFGMFLTITVFLWYRVDAWIRGYRPGFLLHLFVLFLGPLSLPLYFFLSRPRDKATQALLRYGLYGLVFLTVSFLATLLGIALNRYF